ncbi:hypothetical protein N7470_002762 [Penicillium chermesinum]|nr:hypothetical protein N7470_002762 [Penicillium chermesinum]
MRPVKKTINVVSTDAKRKNLPSTVYQHSGIQSVTVCFNEVESFLETFLSIPFAEYHQFSIREWFQLIFVIVTASRVCIANGAAGDLDVAAFQARSRMKMLIYLESLTQRMGTLSVPTAGCPDVFYMFAAVLKILIPLYAPRADSIGDQLSSGYENDPTSSSYQTEDTISAAGTSLSRCPVASGSIKETDFWRELDHTESFGDFNPTDAQATHPGDLGVKLHSSAIPRLGEYILRMGYGL